MTLGCFLKDKTTFINTVHNDWSCFWFLDKSLIRPPENSGFSVTVLSFRSSPSIERRNKGRAWREPLGGCSEIGSRLACLTAPPRVTVLGSGGYQTQEVIWSAPCLQGQDGLFLHHTNKRTEPQGGSLRPSVISEMKGVFFWLL